MAKKKINKKPDEQKKSAITASHLMLYIILGIYIIVSLMCIIFMGVCIVSDKYEGVAQTLVIPTVSLVGTCSCTVVGFYTSKASKENEIKLSNDKYRMRLELAKEIFKEYGNSLDDKSVDLLQKLMSDKDVSELTPTVNVSDWQSKIPQVEITPLGSIGNEEGVG